LKIIIPKKCETCGTNKTYVRSTGTEEWKKTETGHLCKKCASKKYFEKNKEKIRDYQKEWVKQNQNKLNATAKTKYHKNIEVTRENRRKRYARNPESYRITQNKRNSLNRDKVNQRAIIRRKELEKGNLIGNHLSDEHKKKISLNSKGRKMSEINKNKMSKRMKDKIPWNKNSKGLQTAWNKGKTGIYSKETIAKISAARAKQKFPYRDTKIELQTQLILEENNIIFKKHKNYKLSESNHQADITIEPDKIIEVNGDYWHFNPKIYHAESTQKLRNKSILAKEKWAYDQNLIEEMEHLGYKVLVVWESELKHELDKTTKKILKFAKS
jgi:G:T-mismatch repair DNA endonuclease (very short patch repair protein)